MSGEATPVEKAPIVSKLDILQRLKDDPEPAKKEVEVEESDESGDADETLSEKAPSDEEAGDDAEHAVEANEGTSDEDEEGEEAEGDEEEDSESDAESEETEEEKPGKSTYEVKIGKEKQALPEDAKIKFTPDGEEKPIEVPLKEVIGSYKSNERIKREFSKLDVDKKTFEKEKHSFLQERGDIETVDTHLKGVVDAAAKGDIPEVYRLLSLMLTGVDETQVRGMMDKSREYFTKLDGMTKEQQELFWEKTKIEREKAELQRQRNEVKGSKEERELHQHVSLLQEKHKITQDDLSTAWKHVQEVIPAEELERLTPLQIADKTAAFAVAARDLKRLDTAILKVAPKISREESGKIVKILIDVKATSLDDADLIDVVKGLVTSDSNSEDSEEGSAKKVAGAKRTATKPKPTPRTAKPSNRAEKKETRGKAVTSGLLGFLGEGAD